MGKLLIVVDMQNDFISGSLGTPEARAIITPAAGKIRSFDGLVIVTYDTHTPDYLKTQEGRRLPVEHCVKGTPGHELHKEIRAALPENALHIEKPTFGSTALVDAIRNIPDVESIELIGLCTDICVISNALLLKASFTEIPILVNSSCCAGVTPQKHRAALEVLASCQIEVK